MVAVEILLILLGMIAVSVYVVSTVMIYRCLEGRGEKISSFIWIRFFMISYANRYKNLTKKETGKVGNLYYIWLISINIALVCVVLLLVI